MNLSEAHVIAAMIVEAFVDDAVWEAQCIVAHKGCRMSEKGICKAAFHKAALSHRGPPSHLRKTTWHGFAGLGICDRLELVRHCPLWLSRSYSLCSNDRAKRASLGIVVWY